MFVMHEVVVSTLLLRFLLVDGVVDKVVTVAVVVAAVAAVPENKQNTFDMSLYHPTSLYHQFMRLTIHVLPVSIREKGYQECIVRAFIH